MRTNKKLGKNNLFGTSDFDYTLCDNGFVVIVDLDQGNTSVTNDMHNVIDSLVKNGLDLYNFKVIYKDSMGIYDAVLIEKDNTHLGIASLNAKTLTEAFHNYNEKVSEQWLVQHNSLNPC